MQPKTINLLYWICTVLFAGFMIFTAIPDLSPSDDAYKFMHDFLGYPVYFIRFIGVAKILGSVAILVPGFNKIKEWAYAGLFFDLVGAIFSVVSASKEFDPGTFFILLPLIVGALSYIFWNKKKAA